MSNPLDVMNQRQFLEEGNVNKAIEKLEKKLDKNLIKQRKIAGKTLDYIEGHTVIDILNKAFQYNWSFEIVSEEVVEAKDKNGNTKGIVKVLGRLTVPGFGVKEQYGAKQLLGGPDMQEGAFKAATTDSLKKCATLFGVGKELYEEDEDKVENNQQSSNKPKSNQSSNQDTSQSKPKLNEKYSNRIKELKDKLSITDNEQLNPYVRIATDGSAKTFKDIDNTNASAVIKVMEQELE